jgi:hypothetical protein
VVRVLLELQRTVHQVQPALRQQLVMADQVGNPQRVVLVQVEPEVLRPVELPHLTLWP